MVVRPSRPEDLDRILALAKEAGTGMTNLPPDRATLSARLEESFISFAKDVKEPDTETYLFVLEEPFTGKIVGTSGIYARVGSGKPFYSYKILNVTQTSHELGITVNSRLLHLVNDYTGCTEVGMLYLSPAQRKNGNGRLLGLSRYLMMAEYPERFADIVIAEMRGQFDEHGHSPFWEDIGKHFFGMAFPKADLISAVTNNQFIADLMPKHPIYIDLLSRAAQDVIGKPHNETKPALKFLEREGFRFEGYVDVFDAGPAVQARLKRIRSVRNSRKLEIHNVCGAEKAEASGGFTTHFVANCRLPDFRVCRAPLRVNKAGSVDIGEDAADALEVGPGDPVRFIGTSKVS